MVVFTCGHCGESVQKPKVEKHYLTKCRNQIPNLSCMDCFKDFIGDNYESHTKCVTEEQRYSGKGFVAKEKKGEKKQNAWVEILQSVLDEQKNAPKNVLRIIETISKHNNTPRKKPKFINFVKNVCGHKTNPKDMDQAWDMISVKLSALSNANDQSKNENEKNGSIKSNGITDEKENNDHTNTEQNGLLKKNSISKEKEDIETNGHLNEENGDIVKKLSKKERKEEKKRKKYEAELESAAALPEVEEEEETKANINKKDKKKKNRTQSLNKGDEDNLDCKNKNKRKRQDTVNSVNGGVEISQNTSPTDECDPQPVPKEKTLSKKKLKLEGDEEADESICLHDQNVAHSEEAGPKSDKFNWHAVIISVLEKKGNEVPFKRLQKKVLGEYSEATGRDIDDRIADKFLKKLRSAPNVRVDKNRVLLVE